jgi:hypothetical protein
MDGVEYEGWRPAKGKSRINGKAKLAKLARDLKERLEKRKAKA